MPVMAMVREGVGTGLRQLVVVLEQAFKGSVWSRPGVAAEALDVGLARLKDLLSPRLLAAQLVLTRLGQVRGIVLQALVNAVAAAGPGGDVGAQPLHVFAACPSAFVGARELWCRTERHG